MCVTFFQGVGRKKDRDLCWNNYDSKMGVLQELLTDCHIGLFPTCAGSTASVAYLKICSVFTGETKSKMWVHPHFQGDSTIHSWENLSSEEGHSPRTLVYHCLPISGPIKRLVPGQASWWGSRTSSCLPCIAGKASWERQVTCLRSQSWWTI